MTDYKNPTPTVDIIIEVDVIDGERRIVLIRRKHEPFGWALPGGFVDEGETVEHAAMREADEETNLEVILQDLLYVYSAPDRDPRQHTMSTVFIATADGQPRGADDAEEARIFGRDDLPDDLVFDHARILKHYFKFRDSGERPSPMAELERFQDG